MNVMVEAEGDTWIDDHHTCEDIGKRRKHLLYSCLLFHRQSISFIRCKFCLSTEGLFSKYSRKEGTQGK